MKVASSHHDNAAALAELTHTIGLLETAHNTCSPKSVQECAGNIHAAMHRLHLLRDALPKAFEVTPEEAVRGLIELMGDDPTRSGLKETPARVVKALKEHGAGYEQEKHIAEIIKTFEDGAEDYDQMVTQKEIPFWSRCEHHMEPFFGIATVAYIPKKRILGLSKFIRVLDVYARRLQVQERLTRQIGEALWKHLEPAGVGAYVRCRHSCIECRGVRRSGSSTITCALFGVMKSDPSAKAEFLSFARGD